MPTINKKKRLYISWLNRLKKGYSAAYRREYFFARVGKTERRPECWSWNGELEGGTPITVWTNGRKMSAYHASARMHGMEGRTFAPICGNKRCVRPDHLRPVWNLRYPANPKQNQSGLYSLQPEIAGNLALHSRYILSELGGSRSLLYRWRKANPDKLFNGRTNGKH